MRCERASPASDEKQDPQGLQSLRKKSLSVGPGFTGCGKSLRESRRDGLKVAQDAVLGRDPTKTDRVPSAEIPVAIVQPSLTGLFESLIFPQDYVLGKYQPVPSGLTQTFSATCLARPIEFLHFSESKRAESVRKGGPAEAVTLSLDRWRSSPPAYPHHYLIALWTTVLVACSVTVGSNKSLQSGPQSCVCMIVCIGLGLSRYKHNDGQDDQINCLSILSILTKQRTYLSILSILMKQRTYLRTLVNRFEKHLPERPAELQTPSCGLCLREGRRSGGMEACG